MNKLCLRQQKMNGNDAVFNSIIFKRMVMDPEIINGLVDSQETVIAQILNRNQCRCHGKVLK